MTQQKLQQIFDNPLGQQLDVIYETSDGKVFIRYSEAESHTEGKLDNTEPLQDKNITDWYHNDITEYKW